MFRIYKTTYPCCHVLQFMFNLLKCVNFVLKKIIKNGIWFCYSFLACQKYIEWMFLGVG